MTYKIPQVVSWVFALKLSKGFGAQFEVGIYLARCAGAQATFCETGMPRLVMLLITK
jgi:hypothetical protein